MCHQLVRFMPACTQNRPPPYPTHPLSTPALPAAHATNPGSACALCAPPLPAPPLGAADPVAMKEFVVAVHARAGEAGGAGRLTKRAQVLLELVVDVKNNRWVGLAPCFPPRLEKERRKIAAFTHESGRVGAAWPGAGGSR